MDEKSGNNGGEMGAPTVEEGQIFHALKAWIEANKDEELEIADEEIIDFLKGNRLAVLRFSEDYSNYESGRCNNGGNYGFWINLEKCDEDGLFHVVHHTTADFDYCGACGSFQGHDEEACGFEVVDLRTEEQRQREISKSIKFHKDRIAELEGIGSDNEEVPLFVYRALPDYSNGLVFVKTNATEKAKRDALLTRDPEDEGDNLYEFLGMYKFPKDFVEEVLKFKDGISNEAYIE